MDPIAALNVGGVVFMTYKSTLIQSQSYFSGLAQAADWLEDRPTELFVDRDPTHFRHVLNWMRGVRTLPDNDQILYELSYEADFYALGQMRDAVMKARGRHPTIEKSLSSLVVEHRQRK